jgi:sulfopyruvate decarboxylase subunit alpha
VSHPASRPPSVATAFADALERHGIDFVAGVPCSLVKGLIAALASRGRYVAETREDAALGLAAGAYLGGRLPAVIMQNSGLGVTLNALASLHRLYRIPCLLLVTWRGHDGVDAPEHILMGAVTPRLLETLGVPFRAPAAPDALFADLAWAVETIRRTREPAALVLRPGLGT